MKQWIHDIWREYRSEVVFGLVLSVLLFASTLLSRLISEDFFDNFLNPALSFAFAIVCFFGAAMCFMHLDNNRIRKTWAIILILWGLWELVMVALFKTASNPFQVGNKLMESTPMLLACVFAWMLLIYPTISIRPGKYNWRRGALFLLPIAVLGIINYFLPFDLRILIALYPFWLMYIEFQNIRRYRRYYLCVSDDPARAFTQQWYLMFVLGYTTDQVLYRPDPWERLRSTAMEEKKEEPHLVNAAYRATLEQWLDKEKPYLSPDFQLMDLRQVLPMNRTYLSQFINAEYGCSFYHWVNGLRIAEAKRLLTEHPEIKMKEIAQQSGFSSPTVFSRVFIRETGMTPREWK